MADDELNEETLGIFTFLIHKIMSVCLARKKHEAWLTRYEVANSKLSNATKLDQKEAKKKTKKKKKKTVKTSTEIPEEEGFH